MQNKRYVRIGNLMNILIVSSNAHKSSTKDCATRLGMDSTLGAGGTRGFLHSEMSSAITDLIPQYPLVAELICQDSRQCDRVIFSWYSV